MSIKYGEDDFPYIKEALRYYIETHPDCHYNYKELFSHFKTEPCVGCNDVGYDPQTNKQRLNGKLICNKCLEKLPKSIT